MNFTVGQQIFGGFFVVIFIDSKTGNVTLASQALGDNSGPYIITVMPSVTLEALNNLASALTATVPHS